MSVLRDAINRSRRRQAGALADAGVAPGGAGVAPGGSAGPPAPLPPVDDGRSQLALSRDTLAEQVTEMHWDLGGLAYEMAIRDHFRLDVLVARAAALQKRDAELAEVERLLALEESASAGACPACGAPHSRGAVYCWQCGATLMERTPSLASSAVGEGIAPTTSMDELLAPRSPADDGSFKPLLPADS